MSDIDHSYILIAILVTNIFFIIAAVFIYRISRQIDKSYHELAKLQENLQVMTKKVMDENDDFFMILAQFRVLFDTIIKRQGKLSTVITTEMAKHDKKVDYFIRMLGEQVPSDNLDDKPA